MRRFFAILTLLVVAFTATAQVEHSIVIDSNSFRAVQTDALTGVNIDPIGMDLSRQPCARVKIFFHRMTREQMEQLEPAFPSGTIDCPKRKVADGNTVFILEFTAKPRTKFYLTHPTFGTSNEVEFDFEGGKEYQLEANLNQTFSIVVNSSEPNVDIYLDNVYRGQTDASKSLTIKDVMIGGHKLKVVYGSVSYEQDIDVNSGSISFRQDVNKAAGEPQFVVFTVEPQSAVVTIGGKHYTLTDGAMRTVLNSGTYNYTVSAVGYHSKSDSFTVAGEKVTRNITLTADVATVTLTVADNAEIWVNGEKKGSGLWSGMLNSGPYIFEAKKAGYKTSTISKQISSAQPNQSFTLPAPTPIVGSIMVDGAPINANVTLDGNPVGQVPLKLNNILIGKHNIAISKEGYITNTQTITVEEGKSTTVNVALTKLSTQSSNATTTATSTVSNTTAKEPIIIDTQNISTIVDSNDNRGIGRDMSYRPCARIKIYFDTMTADEINKLHIRGITSKQMITKLSVEPNQNALIFEITAELNTTFYLHHPSLGDSNSVNIDLKPFAEYTLMAKRNITSAASTTKPTSSQPAATKPIVKSGNITTAPYKVGDYYNDGKKEGVVFEVSADGRSGKIVGLRRWFEQWSSDSTEQKRLIGADSETDGAYNMAKVKAVIGWQSKYPAFKRCADLGEGWYLPANEELRAIYRNKDAINLNMDLEFCWSSTEKNHQTDDGSYCAYYRLGNHVVLYDPKGWNKDVRPVATFGDVSSVQHNLTTVKTYKVGDYYTDGKEEGVVFEVSADGRSGKIVNLKQSTVTLKWFWSGQWGNYGRKIGADSDVDGLYNMEKVMAISGWQDKYPAFKWCADLGKGWYLPSIEELKKILFREDFDKINTTIKSKGGTPIGSSNYYWSSTQEEIEVNKRIIPGARTAHKMNYIDTGTLPTNEYSVRAVSTFGDNLTSNLMQSNNVLTSAPYKVGDFYNDGSKKGVVFEVSADGKHGKIISLIASRAINWAEEKVAKRLIGADNRTDGTYNMNKVQSIKDWKTKYPAFSWCAELGTGWYIPAIEELQKFTMEPSIFNAINHTLKSMGYLELPNRGWYWSSTESGQKYKGIYSVLSVAQKLNKIDYLEKSYYHGTVRAVAKF